MIITLIAAVSEDGYISRDKGIPWHLPADIAHFRNYTADKHLLLGRTTAEEMRDWFQPGHTPIVMTRSRELALPGTRQAASMEDAVALAQGAAELVVCGGASIYEAAMPWAHQLVITHVKTNLGSGKRFPDFTPEEWFPISQVAHPADHQHEHPFQIVTYQRRGQPPLPLPSCTSAQPHL